MTRLLFDGAQTLFHILATSNSRHLILPGNAKPWECYLNCASEFSAWGKKSKYEKRKMQNSIRNYFLLFVLDSLFVLSKVGSWGLRSPLSVNATLNQHLKCEENLEWGEPPASSNKKEAQTVWRSLRVNISVHTQARTHLYMWLCSKSCIHTFQTWKMSTVES